VYTFRGCGAVGLPLLEHATIPPYGPLIHMSLFVICSFSIFHFWVQSLVAREDIPGSFGAGGQFVSISKCGSIANQWMTGTAWKGLSDIITGQRRDCKVGYCVANG
jgi:hypothetical protein